MERFQHTANLLTVIQTCRRQGRSVIDFFEQSLRAHRYADIAKGECALKNHNLPGLSLIPTSHT
jgi:hypothetical protein